jgi:sulfotransferase family protein
VSADNRGSEPVTPELTRPLPRFVIIGAQKSGTRWLRQNLGKHPEIFAAPTELEFFNRRGRFRLGVDWYQTQFSEWSGEPIMGEATPGYMMFRNRPWAIAKRIASALPDVRLIAILRNPVDRANSAMVHHILRERLPPTSTLVELARQTPPDEDRLGLITGGWYGASLATYVRIFGDRLLVVLHDDAQSDPGGVYDAAIRHVGASPGFVPSGLDQVVFSNQERDSGRHRRPVAPEDRRELYAYFRDDITKLERLLDRDLSIWSPAPE